MNGGGPLRVGGWSLFAHPVFLDQLSARVTEVEALRAKDRSGVRAKNPTERLAAIAELAFEVIPQDPAPREYRPGDTLGVEYKHWFRAKFFQQYRLFFRFHAKGRVIVYAWVNDEKTKRDVQSADDAYRVFRRMLVRGRPPSDWSQLLAEARAEAERLGRLVSGSARVNP